MGHQPPAEKNKGHADGTSTRARLPAGGLKLDLSHLCRDGFIKRGAKIDSCKIRWTHSHWGEIASGMWAHALLIRCRPLVPNSTRPRTSGSICAKPISATGCSPITPPSSTPARTLGENFSPRQAASPRSLSAIGPPSVNLFEGWYKIVA
jgi:hypothetical protein